LNKYLCPNEEEARKITGKSTQARNKKLDEDDGEEKKRNCVQGRKGGVTTELKP